MQVDTKISQYAAIGNSGGPVTVLAFAGDISSASKSAVLDAYHSLDAAVTKLLLDFDKVGYINSSGIATIIQMLLEAKKGNDRVVGIFGLSPHFTKVFTMVGVPKYAELSADLTSALTKL
ncbi:STAS domain-containing protein [Terriglobus sp.]|uniref:STAS domain-containing protein n=1 Tax=Terriglobus sp. TaxID=1889013 RepID=UPI003B00F178